MDARVEDLVGLGEDRLGPVAVVDVPVEHQHPLDATRLDRMPRRHRDVVEEAESHRPAASAWCPGGRRPQNAKLLLSGEQPLDRVDRAPRRVERRLE